MDFSKISPDKLKGQIAEWEDELEVLKEKAKKMAGDTKLKKKIEGLEDKIDEAKAKIADLKGKGKDILGKFKL